MKILRTTAVVLVCASVSASALGAVNPRDMQTARESLRELNSESTQQTGETIRVRVSRVKNQSLNFSGSSLRFSGLLGASSGYRAFTLRWERPANRLINPQYTWIVSDRDRGGEILRVNAPSFAVHGEAIRVGVKAMPDRIEFVPVVRGAQALDVVAKLDLEDYLRGVLPSEMPASWPLEALKAQAIAARTFALFRKSVKAGTDSNFDVESDVMDQVFRHPLKDDVLHPRNKNVERALQDTKSVVLLDARNQAFQAYFHADCGGQTEEAKDVWGSGLPHGTAMDGSCPLNPRATWFARFTGRELASKLRVVSGRASSFVPVSIQVVKRTSSGRIAKLALKWNDGTTTSLTGHQFRMAVGYDNVKSTQFKVVGEGSVFSFSGVGYGHGVGMCQWGAKQMAMSGKSYKDILAHYYSKARLAEESKGQLADRLMSRDTAQVADAITSPRKL